MFIETAAASIPMQSQSLDYAVNITHSIETVGRDAWNRCFHDEVERFDYLLAVERAGIPGFEWRYACVFDSGQLVAAMPAFLSRYGLETTVDSPRLRAAVAMVRRFWPKFLAFPLACLGSPCTETGAVGFHPRLSSGERITVFKLLLSTFESAEKASGHTLFALKDIPATFDAGLRAVITTLGYAKLDGLPTAHLDIDFDGIDAYLTRLSPATRKDMRRKLRNRSNVRLERRTDFGPHLGRAVELYNSTRERSDWQFEELTEDYFSGILAGMPGHAFVALYFVEDRLVATNLLVHDKETLIDKFFCMDPSDRPYNLYFLSWFDNIEYCLTHGFKRYQSGQAYYENKIRLGSRLATNTMYFRHRCFVLHQLFSWIAPFFGLGETESVAK